MAEIKLEGMMYYKSPLSCSKCGVPVVDHFGQAQDAERVREILEKITYKPGWCFHHTRDGFMVNMRQQDVRYPGRAINIWSPTVTSPVPLKYITEGQVRRMIWEIIRDMEHHEMEEWFAWGGRSVHDPHTRKDQAYDWDLRCQRIQKRVVDALKNDLLPRPEEPTFEMKFGAGLKIPNPIIFDDPPPPSKELELLLSQIKLEQPPAFFEELWMTLGGPPPIDKEDIDAVRDKAAAGAPALQRDVQDVRGADSPRLRPGADQRGRHPEAGWSPPGGQTWSDANRERARAQRPEQRGAAEHHDDRRGRPAAGGIAAFVRGHLDTARGRRAAHASRGRATQ